ncbi:DNA-3-methyladenine glycosylase I [Vibrio sp. CAIM 722]|uniref:DNA-3-methyladenine glycosylase I n=1 Tax=Vibrio eleionomae TaxID=2653505 RepID=A0A7X4LKN5_9VIBR|nr:DNA-3-methyladenine glycosylase I [Vibrio eleionomae]MZI93738.1 DNA-3-methyladenine glycosylase I [Vibrio eleionomae]
MTIEKFDSIYQRACERKGSQSALESLLRHPLTKEQIAQIPDDRWLAAFTMKVFQSGIQWKVVADKWPNFEQLFFQFRLEPLLMQPDEAWEEKAQNPGIIRYLPKVMTIPANAQMIFDIRLDHGSFGKWVAQFPQERIVDLWLHLKKHGKRLGGNTGPYALRQLGVDTFLLTHDIEAYLRATKVIDGGKDTKRTLYATNDAFNQWHEESGRSFTEISQIIAYSTGDNRV